jgi:hypothetical protein
MLDRRLALCLTVIVISVLCAAPCKGDNSGLADAEQTLRQWKVEPTASGVLGYLQSQTLDESARQALERCIVEMGSDRFADREQATQRIKARGQVALPYLRRAHESPDLEIVRRAEACIEAIEHGPGPALPRAALRWLAARKCPGSAATILAYLAGTEDESIEDEAIKALVTLRDADSAERICGQAIASSVRMQRAAAAAVLGRSRDPAIRHLAREMLADPEAIVRFHAAAALLAARDCSALPTLAGLVSSGQLALALRSEELLERIAGQSSPEVSLTLDGPDARRRAGEAWLAWWEHRGQGIDLTDWDNPTRLLGYTIVAEIDSNRVWECSPSGKARWKIEDLEGPIDARMLNNGHVLIAESHGQRVTERDLTGRILWQKQLEQNPVCCQRLANGNTFVATYQGTLEITPDGREINVSALAMGFMFGAERLDNGNLAYVTAQGVVVEQDTSGRAFRTLATPHSGGWCSVECLANGSFLIALSGNHEILEMDAQGRTLWRCSKVSSPCFATRLPNGHTLVCSLGVRRTGGNQRVVEVDESGNIVWTLNTDGRPFRAHRR